MSTQDIRYNQWFDEDRGSTLDEYNVDDECETMDEPFDEI